MNKQILFFLYLAITGCHTGFCQKNEQNKLCKKQQEVRRRQQQAFMAHLDRLAIDYALRYRRRAQAACIFEESEHFTVQERDRIRSLLTQKVQRPRSVLHIFSIFGRK